MLLLDCRYVMRYDWSPRTYKVHAVCSAERKLDQVCSDQEYRIVFDRVNALPAGVEHLVVQLGQDFSTSIEGS